MVPTQERQWDFMRTASWILCILTELALAWVFFVFLTRRQPLQTWVVQLGPQAPPISDMVAGIPTLVVIAIALLLGAGLVLKEAVLVNNTATIIINATVFFLVVIVYMVVHEALIQALVLIKTSST